MQPSTIPSIGNAAGTCNSERQFNLLLKSAVNTITIGPMAVLPRDPNPGNNAYRDRSGRTINSMGLPGIGIEESKKIIPAMIAAAAEHGKVLSLTIPPIDEMDDEKLANAGVALGVEIIEFNAGCANVWVNGKQKRILSFNPRALERSVSKILSIVQGSKVREVRVKLSPYSDPVLLAEVADALEDKEVTIVTCNTFANAWMFREEDNRPAIEFGKHLGGYGGVGMKPIALGQVAQFLEHLPNHHIIGVGGIQSGRDLWEFASLGVDEAQIGSAWYFSENARIFGGVIAEYLDIIEEHPLWTPATT
ncbi:MAG: hypothetical protein WBP40_04235 [Candidatus Moraniibacteriota bacterium]